MFEFRSLVYGVGFGVGGLKRGGGYYRTRGVALLALRGGMNSGVFGSKETDKLWMDEGRGRGVPGNYGVVLALHWINLLFRKYVYPGGGEVWSSLPIVFL